MFLGSRYGCDVSSRSRDISLYTIFLFSVFPDLSVLAFLAYPAHLRNAQHDELPLPQNVTEQEAKLSLG